MRNAAIIVAGGSGKRLRLKTPKQFLKICQKPMLFWSVETFLKIKSFKQIIVSVHQKFLKNLKIKYKNEKLFWTKGGKERFDSVKNGLNLIHDDIDFVAIHDAARPLISVSDILKILKTAKKSKAAIAVEKTKDTIKLIDEKNTIIKTFDRIKLRNAQTPQIFEKNLIKKAYSKKIPTNTTDDAQLVEALGTKVVAVETQKPNFKITLKSDLILAEQVLGKKAIFNSKMS
ncbi:MAG: 2-C-methyl-D-erythritol 4-phosphate cytidylyltransferase [Elusimicrobiota bacterium]|jgi:2-C-methyl-D-erythritol 4-phosphate cytidylyltransferase|nr:2-C-methyl-D-erythritol 4-phosphate cytidylyltransferase [Elusimicrobiota bacterium]